MKIPFSHFTKHIVNKIDKYDISEKLFQLGHEHEINEEIFDFELTPNRGDCLSLKGMLRDLNLFYEIDFNKKVYEEKIDYFDFQFSNNVKSACPKISFLKIEIESVPEKYNDELESYFHDLKISKNNFFTDISNFLSYETGQPTHCYSASKLENGIRLDLVKDNQKFETLTSQTIEVEKNTLAFFNNDNEIINLAGIMGGLNSSCDKKTKTVIVECAYFNPEIIMGKALKYSITSDAAHKFERNVDYGCQENVLRRFIKVVEEHTKILNISYCFNEYIPKEQTIVHLDYLKINNILGTNISKTKCVDYLNNLGFSINIDKSIVRVPYFRNDVNSLNDLAEEIARAIGYDNIRDKKFKYPKTSSLSNNTNENKLKNFLVNNGFFEVINDPFTKDYYKNSIQVDNPLDSNRGYLRTSLKSSLLSNFQYNERRQHDSIKLFEISDIYKHPITNPIRNIGIIISGRVDKNYLDFNRKLDKEYMQDLLQSCFGKDHNFNCEIISRNELKSKSKSKNQIIYTEIELNDSIEVRHEYKQKNIFNLDTRYIPVSEFPSISRDLSFSILDFSKFVLLQDLVLNFKHKFLKEVFIFDYYLNETKKEIKIGYRFIFQSKESTLTDNMVSNIIQDLVSETYKIDGVSIPGMRLN